VAITEFIRHVPVAGLLRTCVGLIACQTADSWPPTHSVDFSTAFHRFSWLSTDPTVGMPNCFSHYHASIGA